MGDSIIPAFSPEHRSELRALHQMRAHLDHGQSVERYGVAAEPGELAADITTLETIVVAQVSKRLGTELEQRLGAAPGKIDWNRFFDGSPTERSQRAQARAHRDGVVAAVRLYALSALGAPSDLDEVIAKGPADPLCGDLFEGEVRRFRDAQQALHIPLQRRVARHRGPDLSR